jgi:hypothetical protein
MVDADEIPDVFTQAEIEAPEERVRCNLSEEEHAERAKKILERALAWKHSSKKDDVRAEHASGYGGFELYDQEKLAKIRSALGVLVSKAGQKNPQWRLQPDED